MKNIPDIDKKSDKEYIFTKHAIARFTDRSNKLGIPLPKDIKKTLQKLIGASKPENINPMHKTIRLINNKYKDCQYLTNNGWRFVISEDGKTVITIERVIYTQN